MEYDRTEIPSTYARGRKLPEATLRIWLDAISNRIVGSINCILDVGCGTGRFSEPLARFFGVKLFGIDPSFRMLDQAPVGGNKGIARFVNGDAHSLPIKDGSFDLIFLSMVYHHLDKPARAIQEFQRVVRPGGSLGIRNSTLDLLDTVPYLKYFPSARQVCDKMLPGTSELIGEIERNGFLLVDHTVINQAFAGSFKEYRERIAQRAQSDLASIPNSEFKQGLEEMERDEDSRVPGPIIEPVDLFVFSRS